MGLESIYRTPYLAFDGRSIYNKIGLLKEKTSRVPFKLLYPLKASSIIKLLEILSPFVSGFSISSANEARLVSNFKSTGKSIHITTPSFDYSKFKEEIGQLDYFNFNSITQFERYSEFIQEICMIGLRVNTNLKFVSDDRYNPCKNESKLGVSLDQLLAIPPKKLRGIDGILFHTNCESKDFNELMENVKHLDKNIPDLLKSLNYVNIGGGYLFDDKTDWEPFINAVNLLVSKYDLEVFFEPGKGIVSEAGYLVSSVVDLFVSDGKIIAVLDTTVNHMPEVFEYQYKPSVMQESDDGKHRYILAGASCLAGDLFGEYSFDEPLEVGSKIVFEDMGAYTFVKANMFNGINLPSIYLLRESGELQLIREFDDQDFLSIYGAKKNETLRKRDQITSKIWSK
jgi:carboxynorspermidine decarboxylase